MCNATERGASRTDRPTAATVLLAAFCACGGGGGWSPVPTEPATFQRIQAQIFDRSCAQSSCHGSAARAADLLLEDGAAYAQLVGVAPSMVAARERGLERVAPGEPERSLLLWKVSSGLPAEMGHLMPYGGPYLTAKAVETVRAWIAAGAPRTGRVPGDDGAALGVEPGDDTLPDLPPPLHGVQLHVTARPLAAGSEETLCHNFKLPSAVDLDAERIEFAVGGGSHHIHLYRPLDPDEVFDDGFYECNFALDFERFELVAATQNARSDWQLPAGVAYHFRANEQLVMQTHFVNVGALSTPRAGHVLLNLHAADPGAVSQYAGSLFGQNRDVLVPPRSMPTLSGDCLFPAPIEMLAMTGHYHFRGRAFTVDRLGADGTVGERIYAHQGYEDPLFQIFDPPALPVFAAGDGLRWTCTWENDSNREYRFGPFTESDEHCNLFAFYTPIRGSSEATACVVENGVSTTTVRSLE